MPAIEPPLPSAIGRYRVTERLGGGGMGEVFRAHDDVLDRIVAVKVVAAGYHSDPGARPRFERERRLTASLDHPHICRLLDAGHENGLDYFVMEYLEGETLATRLQGGPLPFDAFLTYATQIADALAYAHARGVIHRDLKPANIYLTPQGAKLLDFGLAKLIEADHAEADQRQDTVPVATPATVLGTPCYLAPERLRGTAADERTDLYGFGLILFEMASGRRAFGGPTGPALFNAILSARRGALNLGPGYPASLERLIETCLAVDPAQRWGSAGEVAAAVRRLPDTHAAPNVKRRSGRNPAWALALAVILASVVAGLWLLWSWSTTPERWARTIVPAEGTEFSMTDASVSTPQLALSPDGSRAVVVLQPPGDPRRSQLWVQTLDSLVPYRLEGTEGASYPFWAPNGESIGFFADHRLKWIGLSDGVVHDLAQTETARGGTWNSDGTIVFAPANKSVLYRIPATGGTPIAVTQLNTSRGETSHRWPAFLAGGKELVYLARSPLNGDAIYRVPLSGGSPTRIVASAHGAVPFDRGLLVIQGETLHLHSLEPSTDGSETLVLVAKDVAASTSFYAPFSASADAVVVAFAPLADRANLNLVDRGGNKSNVLSEKRFADYSLSPDGVHLAVAEIDPKSGSPDIVITEMGTRNRSPLVNSPDTDASPVWLSTSELVFRSNRSGVHDLYLRDFTAQSGTERLLLMPSLKQATYPTSVSRDRLLIYYVDTEAETRRDIWARRPDGKQFPLVTTTLDEYDGRISPDGKWLAYTVEEKEPDERVAVYLRPLDNEVLGATVAIRGASDPRWHRDGGELYFIDRNGGNSGRGVLKALSVKGTTAASPSAATRLFDIDLPPLRVGGAYEVANDGYFLVREPLLNPKLEPLHVFKGWSRGVVLP